jgi:hypothetical protein
MQIEVEHKTSVTKTVTYAVEWAACCQSGRWQSHNQARNRSRIRMLTGPRSFGMNKLS